ncbi:MAG: hypothetical protein V3U80_10725 [Flavobacteriaceae bacterium]
MDLERVEKELKKRWETSYNWGRKQSDDWDKKSNFIYTTYSYKKLLERTEKLSIELKNYALNRWYNYWSAKAVESIFTTHKNIIAQRNVYDKLVDFTINNIPFDHKTTVFPKGFKKDIAYAIKHKKELITWLYNNQSQQGRKHLKNRLFVVLYDDTTKQHWKMKAEINCLKFEIEKYISNFSKKSLTTLNLGEGSILSDIVWIKK